MAYTKTNWQRGDTITAAKLNNIEGSVGFYAISYDYTTGNLSASYNNITSAIGRGQIPVIIFSAEGTLGLSYCTSAYIDDGTYIVTFMDGFDVIPYYASSATTSLNESSPSGGSPELV